MPIASINPTTGEVLKSYAALTDGERSTKLDGAAAAYALWRQVPIAQRAAIWWRVAELLEQRSPELGAIATWEMGKPIAAAMAEVSKCATVCRYYAEHGAELLAPRPAVTQATETHVRYDPLGIILAVMPWNFPFWQVLRCAAPILMAGNVMVLKHASNVPQCAIAIEALLRDGGMPPGVFQTLLITTDQIEPILADPRVQGATLTGSEAAGQSLAIAAGKHLKKVVLELGGSDPFIVMPSADVERAVQAAVMARMQNNGQSCIAAKRFILHRAIASQFTELLQAQLFALRVGNPLLPETQVGPLATPKLRQELHAQVQRTIALGGTLLLGGDPAPYDASFPYGCFYPPTILTDIPHHSPAAQEELFGPVAALFTVDSLEEAIALANQSDYGLGASIWSSQAWEQQQGITELEAGAVFVNGMVKSHPAVPFGGIKRSGYGRELGRQGIHEFTNIKTVCTWE
ncbi:MAG: NAD-dependent succinate-semialdehyde dehydrogenase [Oscillatoriales cyanobacterium SM2_2_1]|nr:NAD-dependent succinate-semialdehyde dehydrogenase [Oscillatoriales cyanobacterium SM2_2_1]